MPRVEIDGVLYVPAEETESLKRWHREALQRIAQLEEHNAQTIKLLTTTREAAKASNV